MNRKWIVGAITLVIAVVALIVFLPRGSGGPKPFAFGRDACARCRMTLSRPGFGGEMKDETGQWQKYDDVGCLLQGVSARHGAVTDAWVENHTGGALIPLTGASFVRGSSETTPMNHGILAFKDAASAAAFVKTSGGYVVPLEALLKDPALSASAPALAEVITPFTDGDASLGRVVFERECQACHGVNGDGKSPAADFLDPKPRDFTKKNFRFHTSDSGRPPRTADILRTIEHGIPGGGMPSFAFLTPDERRQAGAQAMKFAGLLGTPEEPSLVAADLANPPASSPETIAAGKTLFMANCASCHGETGKGDGKNGATLKTAEGNPIKPRDFTAGVFKGGDDRRDLFTRIATGLDGTPMPSFADTFPAKDRWAIIDYVQSLKNPAPAPPFPADTLAAGRMLAEKYRCRGCHVLDDGNGGEAGPDLRVSGQKLDPAFVRRFLSDPRSYGKIYPWRVSRMPDLKLSATEIDVAVKYLAAMGKRDATKSPALPEVAAFTPADLSNGQLAFTIRCTQCHALGNIVKTPLASQQGPDLIRVSERVDFDWAKSWITDPKKIDPKTKMAVPGLTPPEIESIRKFVWKSSMDARAAGSAKASTGSL